MEITKSRLKKIVREAIIAEAPTLTNTGMSSSGRGAMPDVPKKDRDTMVKEIEPQLNAAIESGNTKGIPQGWIDNHKSKLSSIHDADPKFSLRRPERNGGPTDEELMALSKALNPSMFTKFKRMIGMKEGNLRLTENQLRRVIREALLREAADLDKLYVAAAKEADSPAVDPAGIPTHKGGGSWSADEWMEYLYEAEATDYKPDAVIKYVKAAFPEVAATVDEMFSETGPRTLDPAYEAFADLIDTEDYTGDPLLQADTAPGAIKVSPIYVEKGAGFMFHDLEYRWWLWGNNIEPLAIDIKQKASDKDGNVYSAEELFQQITGGKESRFKVPKSLR